MKVSIFLFQNQKMLKNSWNSQKSVNGIKISWLHWLDWLVKNSKTLFSKLTQKIFRNFQGYWRKKMWKFQGSIKKEAEFPVALRKNSCNFHGSCFLTLEFSGVYICHTISLNFQWWQLVFSGISRVKPKI